MQKPDSASTIIVIQQSIRVAHSNRLQVALLVANGTATPHVVTRDKHTIEIRCWIQWWMPAELMVTTNSGTCSLLLCISVSVVGQCVWVVSNGGRNITACYQMYKVVGGSLGQKGAHIAANPISLLEFPILILPFLDPPPLATTFLQVWAMSFYIWSVQVWPRLSGASCWCYEKLGTHNHHKPWNFTIFTLKVAHKVELKSSGQSFPLSKNTGPFRTSSKTFLGENNA